jgi:hypothetical protein
MDQTSFVSASETTGENIGLLTSLVNFGIVIGNMRVQGYVV